MAKKRNQDILSQKSQSRTPQKPALRHKTTSHTHRQNPDPGTQLQPYQAADFHPEMKVFLGHCLYRSAMRFKNFLDSTLVDLGINSPCLAILRIVAFEGQISQHDLGRYLEIDKATMVKWIDDLERKGLLRRSVDAEDRRVKNLSLTKEGQIRLKSGSLKQEKIERLFLRTLSTTEQQTVRSLLLKILESTQFVTHAQSVAPKTSPTV